MPSEYTLLIFLAEATKLLFVIAFGACVGSLMNVLVYRLPRGLDIVSPPSRCPVCDTRLTWRENIPVLGWVFLGGRCRFCRAKISPEYPLVEAAIALLFGAIYSVWYMLPREWGWVAWLRPEWAANGLALTWPMLVIVLSMMSCLAAMTLIDAKTRLIPLGLLWFPAIVGFVGHSLHVVVLEARDIELRRFAPGFRWAIPLPGPAGWWWVGAAIGGMVGLGIGNLLLWTGLIRRSFADYDEWERSTLAGSAGSSEPPSACPAQSDEVPLKPSVETLAVPAEMGGEAPDHDPLSGDVTGDPEPMGEESGGAPAGALQDEGSAKPAVSGDVQDDPEAQAELWIQYPHARREMIRELAFLAPCVTLAILGGKLAKHLAGPWSPDFALGFAPAHPVPLWLDVICGSLMGYLVAGGVVWAARILASLAFGKEALGLGDVHLMAGVGACLGWIDPILAFFAAAFIGVFFEVVRAILARRVRRTLAFGPCLALGTAVVVLLKPCVEMLLEAILHRPVNLP
ncbi:MAG: A24 family peptidase [Phycisphaeraceae bacterium]|nr:A24 family peptidase [Phycisphaeraceae bacterium]